MKKKQFLTSEKNEAFFGFKYENFRVRVNPTQWQKVNVFDICFVSKCL
jgi:hypothetical protein